MFDIEEAKITGSELVEIMRYRLFNNYYEHDRFFIYEILNDIKSVGHTSFYYQDFLNLASLINSYLGKNSNKYIIDTFVYMLFNNGGREHLKILDFELAAKIIKRFFKYYKPENYKSSDIMVMKINKFIGKRFLKFCESFNVNGEDLIRIYYKEANKLLRKIKRRRVYKGTYTVRSYVEYEYEYYD